MTDAQSRRRIELLQKKSLLNWAEIGELIDLEEEFKAAMLRLPKKVFTHEDVIRDLRLSYAAMREATIKHEKTGNIIPAIHILMVTACQKIDQALTLYIQSMANGNGSQSTDVKEPNQSPDT